MTLFYAPNIQSHPILPEIESQHAVRVLRLTAGDRIHITDGQGNLFEAEIILPQAKHCEVKLLQTIPTPRTWQPQIRIALAPTKNMDRNEWFAEKATEIGIDTITFLKTRYSERKEIKVDRIHKIVVSAMKQSLKATLPAVEEMIDFKRLVSQPFSGRKFIAHCYPGEKPLLSKTYRPGEDVLILIGPEGDFSEEEVALALTKGFEPISLGESRLRTETAALTACQTIHILNQ